MKKYHVYNTVQYIKNFFGAEKQATKNPFVAEDVKLLAAMSMSAKMRVSKDGNNFWYYCANNESDNDVAKFLLLRNGVNVMQHKTRLFSPSRRVLRVPQRYLRNRSSALEFVNEVSRFSEVYTGKEVEKYKQTVLRQMANVKVL